LRPLIARLAGRLFLLAAAGGILGLSLGFAARGSGAEQGVPHTQRGRPIPPLVLQVGGRKTPIGALFPACWTDRRGSGCWNASFTCCPPCSRLPTVRAAQRALARLRFAFRPRSVEVELFTARNRLRSSTVVAPQRDTSWRLGTSGGPLLITTVALEGFALYGACLRIVGSSE